MPNIEIISLRFNLDKDEDRRLFELLQKRCDAGKRNEFLKHALLECLSGGGAGGKSVRTSRRQPREPASTSAVQRGPEALEPETLVEARPQTPPKPAALPIAVGQASGERESPQGADSEAAELVASFVQ